MSDLITADDLAGRHGFTGDGPGGRDLLRSMVWYSVLPLAPELVRVARLELRHRQPGSTAGCERV
jgi:hypothetical protein